MFPVQAPVPVIPTADTKVTLGEHLRAAGLAAYREITLAAEGLELAHLQFVFRARTFAVCARVRRDGLVEIEMGLCDARLPRSTITAKQLRQAEAAALARTDVACRSRAAARAR